MRQASSYKECDTTTELTVDPTLLTDREKKRISEIIAYYKATGRKKIVTKDARQKERRQAV